MQYGAWYRKAEKVRWCLHPLSCLWNCSGCRTAKRHAAKAEFVFAYAFYVCFCVCFLCVVFSGVKSRRRISRAPANDKAPSSTQQPVHLPFLLVQIDSAQFHCQQSASIKPRTRLTKLGLPALDRHFSPFLSNLGFVGRLNFENVVDF